MESREKDTEWGEGTQVGAEGALESQQARTEQRRAGGINTQHQHVHLPSGLLSSSSWRNRSGSGRAKVFTDVIHTGEPPRAQSRTEKDGDRIQGASRRDAAHRKHVHTTFASIY